MKEHYSYRILLGGKYCTVDIIVVLCILNLVLNVQFVLNLYEIQFKVVQNLLNKYIS